MPDQSQFLTDSEQRTLLHVAREAVRSAVTGSAYELPAATENLGSRCGVFVTLHRRGELRGCLGRFGRRQAGPGRDSSLRGPALHVA